MAIERLDDASILALIQNTQLQKAFPRLKEIAKKLYTAPKTKSSCNCNKGKKLRESGSQNFAIAELKNYIKQMTQADRDEFKKALHADEIRFTVKDATGMLKELRY